MNLFLTKTLLAESEQRPTVLIDDSIRPGDQLLRFIRKQLSLEIRGVFRIGESGEKLGPHARTEVRQQVRRSDARELLAQTSRLLIQLIQRRAFAPLLQRSARAARSFLCGRTRIHLATQSFLDLRNEIH